MTDALFYAWLTKQQEYAVRSDSMWAKAGLTEQRLAELEVLRAADTQMFPRQGSLWNAVGRLKDALEKVSA